MKDWRGKTIKKGSTIVYPNRLSSNMWMVEAKVQKVAMDHLVVLPSGGSGRVVYLRVLGRVTVVE